MDEGVVGVWGGGPFTHSNTHHFHAHTHSAPVTNSLSEQEKRNFSHEEELREGRGEEQRERGRGGVCLS